MLFLDLSIHTAWLKRTSVGGVPTACGGTKGQRSTNDKVQIWDVQGLSGATEQESDEVSAVPRDILLPEAGKQ